VRPQQQLLQQQATSLFEPHQGSLFSWAVPEQAVQQGTVLFGEQAAALPQQGAPALLEDLDGFTLDFGLLGLDNGFGGTAQPAQAEPVAVAAAPGARAPLGATNSRVPFGSFYDCK
jgi:hypothetical protein